MLMYLSLSFLSRLLSFLLENFLTNSKASNFSSALSFIFNQLGSIRFLAVHFSFLFPSGVDMHEQDDDVLVPFLSCSGNNA